MRTSTSEPTRGAGIKWTALKDVTHYAPLLSNPGRVLVDLGNSIDHEHGLDGEFDGNRNDLRVLHLSETDDTPNSAPFDNVSPLIAQNRRLAIPACSSRSYSTPVEHGKRFGQLLLYRREW